MSYLIAAAGTGGHVFPGLAVGEALVEMGIDREHLLFVGGNRLESEIYPSAGFPFLQVEIAGFKRDWALSNLRLPRVVRQASTTIGTALVDRKVKIALGMGGYVTVPTAIAARRVGLPLLVAEQNASAGLAARFAARSARRVFGSFPTTRGLQRAEWIGNPIRGPLRGFDRSRLRTEAKAHYGLNASQPVVGLIGGSLGAEVINRAAVLLAASSPDYAILNLCGRSRLSEQQARANASPATWIVRDFESRVELFYAAVDAVVARAGGAVAELTATATPSVLIPGEFGSSGHQAANASVLAMVGAAMVVTEGQLADLPKTVSLVLKPENHARMTEATKSLARPNAAVDIARAMRDIHEGES